MHTRLTIALSSLALTLLALTGCSNQTSRTTADVPATADVTATLPADATVPATAPAAVSTTPPTAQPTTTDAPSTTAAAATTTAPATTAPPTTAPGPRYFYAVTRQNVIVSAAGECFDSVGSMRLQGWVDSSSKPFDVTLSDSHREEVLSSFADQVVGYEGEPLFEMKMLVEHFTDLGELTMPIVNETDAQHVYDLEGVSVVGSCRLTLSWTQTALEE